MNTLWKLLTRFKSTSWKCPVCGAYMVKAVDGHLYCNKCGNF